MNRKRAIITVILLIGVGVLFLYPMDVYISKPGGAYDLTPLVEVEGGDENDKGTFSLMTIALAKATPASYAYSTFSSQRKILPSHQVRRSGENEIEYDLRQKRLMSDSQFNAITVAFDRADIPIKVDFDGVSVMSVLENSASSGILEAGDKIYAIDGVQLTEPGQFAEIIGRKLLDDEVNISFIRKDEEKNSPVKLKEIPEGDGRIGLGVQFLEDRTVTTDPEVTMHTSNIGGPSAGLMFTLEIMNRLMDEDLAKGYNIAGTGEMLQDGTVGRIGGADFKVIAATNKGIDIFFAPDDALPQEVRDKNPGVQTNYEEAVATAEKIGSKMEIIPVKTIDDALDYLKNLEPK